MILTANPGRFQLDVVRREFPDADWLVVRGEVGTVRGSWTFEAACCEIFELLDLAGWLRRVVGGDVAGDDRRFEFTEPTLSFELVTSDADLVGLRVYFGYAALPPFARQYAEYAPGETFQPEPVDFSIRRADLRHGAAELERDVAAALAR